MPEGCRELETHLEMVRMVRVTPATTDWASRVAEAEGKPHPALRPPELVLFTVLCCLVSKMLLLNKIRFPNSLRTT